VSWISWARLGVGDRTGRAAQLTHPVSVEQSLN
jgi:hypothetical protein